MFDFFTDLVVMSAGIGNTFGVLAAVVGALWIIFLERE